MCLIYPRSNRPVLKPTLSIWTLRYCVTWIVWKHRLLIQPVLSNNRLDILDQRLSVFNHVTCWLSLSVNIVHHLKPETHTVGTSDFKVVAKPCVPAWCSCLFFCFGHGSDLACMWWRVLCCAFCEWKQTDEYVQLLFIYQCYHKFHVVIMYTCVDMPIRLYFRCPATLHRS